MKTKDNPGVIIPPPLIYVAFFVLAKALQSIYPILIGIPGSTLFRTLGWIFICLAGGILLPSLWKFWRTKNTVVTIRPANSLQTTGIYAYTRNPMYLGLMVLYVGLSCLSQNGWTFISIPFLIFTVQNYIIRREERYLERAFAEEYESYKRRVGRWI